MIVDAQTRETPMLISGGSKMEPMTEKQWQARDDAHTLARAEEIKADPTRMSNAQQAAKNMLEEQRKETQAIAKVARKGSRTNTTPSVKRVKRSTTDGLNVFRKI